MSAAKITATTATTKTTTTNEEVELKLNVDAVVLGFSVPTAKRVPVKADAGTAPTKVSGAVNAVGTETQLLPFQYSKTLARVKLGFEMLIFTDTPELKAPLLEATLMS